jgi:hypothetical protein
MFVNRHTPASREPEPMAREGFEVRSNMPVDCEMAGVQPSAKLAHIRKAAHEELAIDSYRDAIVQEAIEAGATRDEVDAALEDPR